MIHLLIAAALAAPYDASTCPPGAPSPGAAWPDATAATAAAKADAIKALEGYAFAADLDWADKERAGVRTDGLVIVKDGAVIYERYAHGYAADRPHLAWSMSKTETGMLIGMAVGDGKLDVDASICTYVKAPEAACAVKVRDLLGMSSGFDWHETYEGGSPTDSSVLAMLYGQGRGDMGGFDASIARREAPGTAWMYSSGDTNLLADIATSTIGAGDPRFPWTRLFDPIGMTHTTWERDGTGTIVGSSYLYATPRDYARLGELLLDDGCWSGKRLLPDGWVRAMTTPAPALSVKAYEREGWDGYGWQTWLNAPSPADGGRPWPSIEAGAFAARGHWGQSITVIPSAHVVVVRTGDDRDGKFDFDELLRLSLGVAGVDAPLATAPTPPATVPSPTELSAYDTGVLGLASAFTAKEACSCTFVLGMDRDWCKDYVRVSPNVARFHVRDEAVVSHALGLSGATASYHGAEEGCRLDP